MFSLLKGREENEFKNGLVLYIFFKPLKPKSLGFSFWNLLPIHCVVFFCSVRDVSCFPAAFLVAAIVVVYVAHGFCAHTQIHTNTHTYKAE